MSACRDDPTYNQPDDLDPDTDTDSVSNPVGDTDGGTDTDDYVPPTKVCRTAPTESTPGDTVVWLCDGYGP